MSNNNTQMEMVPFNGQQIMITNDQNPLVPMKSLAENIGLDWKGCYNIINKDEVLKSVMVVTTITAADGKKYNTICLPLEYLNGFLFKLNPKRYKNKPVVQDKLVKYQNECYRVLHDYFFRGYVVAPWKKKELARFLEEHRKLERRNAFLEQFAPNKEDYGKPGENGKLKVFVKHGYYATEGAPVVFEEVQSSMKNDDRLNLFIEQLLLDEK